MEDDGKWHKMEVDLKILKEGKYGVDLQCEADLQCLDWPTKANWLYPSSSILLQSDIKKIQ